ncbi:DUF393 domain-containing protein [Paenibacillus sp. MWE-103]|uniref:DUF393 domain-containing protein n=1 Tax=Paenibacillus artemisiicola TaxID=1172618 RepID=A0ABS3WB14_9BACL|nr:MULTISPECIES: DUF393 domain-containing protein [Paenibacillus]MBO7745507.1 DUF393 domain-containing protein [Paenibacillus artemisiicola]SFJ09923.1 Predicted thiol-disulfide oxidoreductase YuxK, DCC family [Paenibacillus sp. UNC496MF]
MGSRRKQAEEERREKLIVLYDGTCNLCLASVRRLKELQSTAILRFIPVQSLEDTYETIPELSAVTEDQLLTKMHVVEMDGTVHAGAAGVVRILRTVRGWRWLAPLYRVPGLRGVADLLYRIIAGRRYEWFGRSDESCHEGVCALPKRD